MPPTGVSWILRAVLAPLALCMGGCAPLSDRLTSVNPAMITGSVSLAPPTLDEPLDGALDVHDAVARALKYNATLRTQDFAVALAEAKARAQSASMLPSIVAESRMYGRNSAQSSRSSQSSTYSTSSDLQTVASELTLSLNILDFGLAYVRSEQAADRIAREQEEMRRTSLRISEETRVAYWRAVTLDALVVRLEQVRPDVERMLAESRRASRNATIDPLVSLNYERDVLNLRRDLNQLRTSLTGAREQLKQLMGVPQDADLRLRPHTVMSSAPLASVEDDVARALANRPEVRQIMLDLNIADREVEAAVLQLLPGISLSRGLSSDSTSYLLNGSWITWGAKAAWDLINLVQLPRDVDVMAAQQQVHRQQALAMAATIAMQVHLSRARIAATRQAATDAEVFAETQSRMLRQVRAAAKVGTVAPQALTKERLATLLAEVRAQLARSDCESAIAAHAAAVGQIFPSLMDVLTSPVADIARALRGAAAAPTPRTWAPSLVPASDRRT